jgi:hypothetical protein
MDGGIRWDQRLGARVELALSRGPKSFRALTISQGSAGASPSYGVVKTTQRVLALFHVL